MAAVTYSDLMPTPEGKRMLHRIWMHLMQTMPKPTRSNKALRHAMADVRQQVDMLYRCGFPTLAAQAEAFARIDRAEQKAERYQLVDVPGMAVQALSWV